MDKRLNQEELAKVIAEIEQLSRKREMELDRTQVQEILQELNLSPDLLDDALVQVQRREVLAVQTKQRQWVIAGVIGILIMAIAATTVYTVTRQTTFAQITAYSSNVTLAQDQGIPVNIVDRQTNPTAYYRVTLTNAPLGEKLSLTCNWIDPSGQIAHQSQYQTRQVDRNPWPTYCYYEFNSTAKTGSWQVEMRLGDHIISKNTFTVK